MTLVNRGEGAGRIFAAVTCGVEKLRLRGHAPTILQRNTLWRLRGTWCSNTRNIIRRDNVSESGYGCSAQLQRLCPDTRQSYELTLSKQAPKLAEIAQALRQPQHTRWHILSNRWRNAPAANCHSTAGNLTMTHRTIGDTSTQRCSTGRLARRI